MKRDKSPRPAFSRERPAAMEKMISVRVSSEQNDLLESLAPLLDLRGKADVVRVAVDYFLAQSPDARAALERLKR